jgi:hypothetical protein
LPAAIDAAIVVAVPGVRANFEIAYAIVFDSHIVVRFVERVDFLIVAHLEPVGVKILDAIRVEAEPLKRRDTLIHAHVTGA